MADYREQSTFGFGSGWASVSDSGASGGTLNTTTASGSDLTFSFTGSAASVVFKASPTGGKLAVTLDAGTANARSLGEIDQCAPAAAQQHLRTFTGLGSGAHSLQLTYVGGSCGGAAAQGANVDAAVVYADLATYDHDDDNRLLASHAGGQDTTYVYDANASLLRRRNIQNLRVAVGGAVGGAALAIGDYRIVGLVSLAWLLAAAALMWWARPRATASAGTATS